MIGSNSDISITFITRFEGFSSIQSTHTNANTKKIQLLCGTLEQGYRLDETVSGLSVRSVACSHNGKNSKSNSWDDAIHFESGVCVRTSLYHWTVMEFAGILNWCLEFLPAEVGDGCVPYRITKQCKCRMHVQRNYVAINEIPHSRSHLHCTIASNPNVCERATSPTSSEIGLLEVFLL